jgi:hypothetical protein
VAVGAITLNGPDGARVTGMLIANSGLLDGAGVLVVAGRGMSRRVVIHCTDDTATRRTARQLSPSMTRKKAHFEGSWEPKYQSSLQMPALV